MNFTVIKRIYALFVAVSVVCSLYADIPAGLSVEGNYDENTYIRIETLSGNEAALTYFGTTAEHAIIPSVVSVVHEGSEYELPITAIAPSDNNIFHSYESPVSVEIPNSVEIIGNSAFRLCSSLEIVKMGDGVKIIGDDAFYLCGSLTSVDIPASVESIGDDAFAVCTSITSVDIPANVESIGDGAFSSCESLASVRIGNGVKSIGERAFSGCESLASIIEIPASVTNIGYGAFNGCPNLENITVDKKNPYYDSREGCNAVIKTLTNELVAGCKNSFIPNSVESIGESAFSCCSSLASVKIPNSVKSIGEGAFMECTSLTSINIPASVESIRDETFSGCSSLESVKIPTSVKSIGESAFSGCTSLTSVEIPANVESVESATFEWCTSLASVEIPNSVEIIGSWAFIGCTSLASVEIPNSVKIIGWSAFDGCESLTSVDIPANVESIGGEAFKGCTSLATVRIGTGMKEIGGEAFTRCYSLESVYCAALTPPDGGKHETSERPVFDYYFGEFDMEAWELIQPMPATLYVPDEAIERYKDAELWGKGECEEDSDYPYGQRCEYFQIIKPMSEGTGTEDVREDDGFAVYVRDGMIYVEETEEEVEVYDVTGRKVYDGEKGAIPVGRPGVYIVRSGENVEKVVAG